RRSRLYTAMLRTVIVPTLQTAHIQTGVPRGIANIASNAPKRLDALTSTNIFQRFTALVLHDPFSVERNQAIALRIRRECYGDITTVDVIADFPRAPTALLPSREFKGCAGSAFQTPQLPCGTAPRRRPEVHPVNPWRY